MYRITTDSTADLPYPFLQERGIASIGLRFQVGSNTYRESPDNPFGPKELYAAMRAGATVSTQQINPYDFVQFADPFLAAGEDVLHISFSNGLSGTYASVLTAAEELKEKYPDRTLVVVDSLCASLGEGLLVWYADENRKAGMTLADNAAWVEKNKWNICHWFTVEDLQYLHRGGRVSKSSAILGSLLGIKPVMHVDNEGHLVLVSKVRGRQKSIETLAENMKASATGDVAGQTVFISHGDCEEDAKKLQAIITQTMGCKTFLLNLIGPVIGSHSGPGTLALFFMGTPR